MLQSKLTIQCCFKLLRWIVAIENNWDIIDRKIRNLFSLIHCDNAGIIVLVDDKKINQEID